MTTENSILVVDDSPLLLSGTSRVLRQEGYTVLEAKTGREALEFARSNQPDLILLDNVLPDITGLDVCKQLKAHSLTSKIFICILSGTKIHSSDQSNGLDSGADDYLTRPIDNRELVARVNAMLRLRDAEKNLELHNVNLEKLVEKRTEELQSSRHFSQSILNSLTGHIAVLDSDGCIVAVNEAWRNFGRENECKTLETITEGANYLTTCRQAIGSSESEHAEKALQGIQSVIQGGCAYFSHEYPCHSPDEERFFLMKAVPLTGEQSRIVVSHENISQLKMVQFMLQKRSQEMAILKRLSTRASQSLSVEDVINGSLAGILEATNANSAFLLRKQGEELIPAGVVFSNPDRSFDEFPTHRLGECLCGRSVSEKKPYFSFDIHEDDRCTWDECKQAGLRSAAALPLYSGDEIIAVLGLATDSPHDFEEQREYLETLAAAIALGLQNALLFEQTERHAEHLEHEVDRRTAQLEQANVQLQELDRLKSMFIASMSHELRTPLNSIIGFSGILLQGLAGDLNNEQSDQLGRISRAGKHLLSLITDVIDVSKIEAGKIDVYPDDIDVLEVIEQARDEIEMEANLKSLTITVDAAQNLSLHSDRRRILQCLVNLISNAVKYSESGEIKVTATAQKDSIEISVSDNGIGIAESEIDKLFSPFVRLDSPLKTKAPGTGLGLYLTRKIIDELLGGHILVSSELSRGSVFTISLPVNYFSTVKSENQAGLLMKS